MYVKKINIFCDVAINCQTLCTHTHTLKIRFLKTSTEINIKPTCHIFYSRPRLGKVTKQAFVCTLTLLLFFKVEGIKSLGPLEVFI
jgi:hypothetical protein